jgi:glycosyltransferase involved in cell wall biosynthesis
MNDKSTMNKIMEYMALGKPIVQFDLTEGRYSAQDAALYASDVADFGDKIIALLDDPKQRAEMGAFGRRRVVDELAWQHEAPKLLAAYEATLGNRKPPPALLPHA